MDPSALIFIALAVAWAAYLIPQAIKHHDAVQRTRSVERFSDRMRVLARREPTSSKDSRLVVTPERVVQRPKVEVKPARQNPVAGPAAPVVESRPVTRPVSAAARRAAANAAARRRRNVLTALVTAVVVVAALAFGGLFSPRWTGVPVGVVAAWLVACRLMVKQERRAEVPVAPQVQADVEPTPVTPVRLEIHDETGEIVAVTVDDDPSRWDMVPVTLPTYVTKPAAAQPRVSTIDLEGTGVWTSGRTEVDAEIARQAEERRRAGQRIAAARQQEQRAVGS